MSSIYENVYIGAFILALGHRMGREMPDSFPLASVNLYQQTPADGLLGDLLVDLAGSSVLLEFKRDWNQIPSEVDKFLGVDFGAEVARRNLTEVADSCHFMGFPMAADGAQVDLGFCSYLSLWNPERNRRPPASTRQLDGFLRSILSGDIGVAADRLREYVELLSDSDAGGVGCLLVNVGVKGDVRLFVVDEIRLLQKTRVELEERRRAEERMRRQQEPPEDLRVRIKQ